MRCDHLALVIQLALALAVPGVACAQGFWTDWATNNPNADNLAAIHCDDEAEVYAFEGREQPGYGLVDMRIRCDLFPSTWAVGNNPATDEFREAYTDGSSAIGIEVREQAGYGLVNARLVYGNGTSFSYWLAPNPAGQIRRLYCPTSMHVSGVQVAEQYGYGLIDIRLFCE